MTLSASMDVVAIVLTLLIIVVGYVVSSYQQYNMLKKIDHKLTLLTENTSEDNENNNHSSNT